MTLGTPEAPLDHEEFLHSIVQVLEAKGLPADAVTHIGSTPQALELAFAGVKTIWKVRLHVTKNLPGQLPVVELLAPMRRLAHVSHYRTICIDDGQGLSIDTERGAEILAYVACDAFRALEDAERDAEDGGHEFFMELEGYWEGLLGHHVRSSVEVNDTSRLIYAHVGKHGKSSSRVCHYFTEYTGTSPPSEFKTEKHSSYVGLYAALTSNVDPPAPGEALGADHVRRLIEAFDSSGKDLWENLLTDRWKGSSHEVFLLLSQPRTSSGRSLIGLSFRVRNGGVDPSAEVRPLTIKRHTVGFMRERGGAEPELAGKRVAIVGCGSIGSEIADALASCGVGRLTLVDDDTFDVENVFRHVLGVRFVGTGKAAALAVQLKSQYPGVEVLPLAESAHSWLWKASLSELDGVVIAIGQPTIERELTRALRAKEGSLPVVVTWLEALGLGGHVVSLLNKGPGCLHCLYRGPEGEPSLYSRTSFLEPGQKVSRNLTGCVGAFVPFSALHSRRTALLAAEAMLNLLRGDSAPQYTYWVGDGRAAEAAGIQVSQWHARVLTEPASDVSKLVFGGFCRECGAEHG